MIKLKKKHIDYDAMPDFKKKANNDEIRNHLETQKLDL